jgi:acyl carrier protein
LREIDFTRRNTTAFVPLHTLSEASNAVVSERCTVGQVTGEPDKMKTELRRILAESARLDVSIDSLSDSDDLYAAGLSSLATVHVMLAIEDEFGIEIPDHMLTRRLFSSVDSLAAAVEELRRSQADA